MAPALNHPPAASFLDEHDIKPVHAEPAAYYGGGDSYVRSRTYSHVCLTFHIINTSSSRHYSPKLMGPKDRRCSRMIHMCEQEGCRTMRRV